jgi:alanine racemase
MRWNTRQPTTQPRRDAWVEVNLAALETNALHVRRVVPNDKALMAIVKADAYGHGAVMVLPVLEACGFSRLGVSNVDEAVQLREAGVQLPILVLGGVPDWAIPTAVQYHLQLSIFTQRHLDNVAACYRLTGETLPVHIKVDTGMHRIGVPWQQAAAYYQQCLAAGPSVKVEGMFTHLACAETEAPTRVQLERWAQVMASLAQPLPGLRHATNTEGTLRFLPLADEQCNLVRVGLALFGYGGNDPAVLQPVMGLKARIVHVQTVPAGEGVSYGHRWQADTPRILATIPVGYADGVPRALFNQMEALLQGRRVPQVGVITMDQMMFDITDVPGSGDITVGDTLTLLGEQHGQRITLTDWANRLGTIEYELMCALRVRLPRIYTR